MCDVDTYSNWLVCCLSVFIVCLLPFYLVFVFSSSSTRWFGMTWERMSHVNSVGLLKCLRTGYIYSTHTEPRKQNKNTYNNNKSQQSKKKPHRRMTVVKRNQCYWTIWKRNWNLAMLFLRMNGFKRAKQQQQRKKRKKNTKFTMK